MSHPVGQYFGNYQLLRPLGQGGFAVVYLGEHRHLGTYAAIKILNARLEEDQIALFQQEARILAQLHHPHIVRMLDYDIADGFPYLVMDYASGGTLRQRHPKGTTLPLATVITYSEQIADALDYAHREKLIHRDVKPENMLINQQGQIVLSDFGVASIAHSTKSQTTAEMAGTVPYIAPEQIHGRPRTFSDQYSLGIVIYEWLNGERPFVGSTGEIVSQHLVATPPPLAGRIPGITPAIEQVIFTALAKDPRQRFATVHDFITTLAWASQDGYTIPQTHTTQPANISSESIHPWPLMAAQQSSFSTSPGSPQSTTETPIPASFASGTQSTDTPAIHIMRPTQSTLTPAIDHALPQTAFTSSVSVPPSLVEQQVEIPASIAVPPTAHTASLTPPAQGNTAVLPTPQSPATTAPRVTALSQIIHQYGRRNLLIVGGIIALMIVIISAGTLYTVTQPGTTLHGKLNVSTTTLKGSGTHTSTRSTGAVPHATTQVQTRTMPTPTSTVNITSSSAANNATATAITMTTTTSTTRSSTSSTAATTTATATPSGGSNGVTATGTVVTATAYYAKEAVTYSNNATITAMTISITVQKTTGVSFSGAYATGTGVTATHVDNGSTIVYTYTLSSGHIISPDTNQVAAQFNLTGTIHPTANDQWSITTTSGGVTNTASGYF